MPVHGLCPDPDPAFRRALHRALRYGFATVTLALLLGLGLAVAVSMATLLR